MEFIRQSFFDGTDDAMDMKAIKLIKDFEPIALKRNPIGYVVGYSGGKDSEVLVDLFKRAGVRYKVIHNHTTLDAPETVRYVRKKFYEMELQGIDCQIYYPEVSFWGLCRKKHMLPTRLMRFCCSELKERDIPELRFATHSFGVRKAESVKRANYRDSIETRNRKDYSDMQKFKWDDSEEVRQTSACYTNQYFIVNPIAYFSEDDVWDYIRANKLEVNPLYGGGYKRVGCIGCPMAGKHRVEEFKRYPVYEKNFRRVSNDIVEYIKKNRECDWKNGDELFEWWIST